MFFAVMGAGGNAQKKKNIFKQIEILDNLKG